MRKRLTALLLSGLLLLTTGCGQQTGDPAAKQTPPEAGFADNADAFYDFGSVQIALPIEHLDRLIVETGEDDCEEDRPLYPRSLMRVYEKASVEALEKLYGSSEGGGFLWGIVEMDQAQFEQLLTNDVGGCQIFARDGDLYYAKLHPTDVQYFRENGEIDMESEDWQMWETLNALGDEICADIIERNGLTPYSQWEFYARPFTWESEHAYIEYYNYYTFDGSKSEFYTLILSQPAKQGGGGLWCVERMIDEYGTTYPLFPDSGLPATDYYAGLQTECDVGEHPELLTPLGAAEDFVRNSGWFNDEPVAESFAFTAEVDSDYAEANQTMSRTISALLVRPETVTDAELLDCIGCFRNDTWAVMGRSFYGSDWWTPLQAALERSAVGDDQEERDRSMMTFYLTSYDRYADFIAGCLQTQRAADPDAFQTALESFSAEQQSVLLSASE